MSEEIVKQLTDAYDDAVRDLSLEEAIDVASQVNSYIEAALMGLEDDLENQG